MWSDTVALLTRPLLLHSTHRGLLNKCAALSFRHAVLWYMCPLLWDFLPKPAGLGTIHGGLAMQYVAIWFGNAECDGVDNSCI